MRVNQVCVVDGQLLVRRQRSAQYLDRLLRIERCAGCTCRIKSLRIPPPHFAAAPQFPETPETLPGAARQKIELEEVIEPGAAGETHARGMWRQYDPVSTAIKCPVMR